MNANPCYLIGKKLAVVDGVVNIVDDDGKLCAFDAIQMTFTYNAGALSCLADGICLETIPTCEPDSSLQTFTIVEIELS